MGAAMQLSNAQQWLSFQAEAPILGFKVDGWDY
jgi:hypothetical protein